MQIVAIDAGSYSVNFIEATIDRKKFNFHSIAEFKVSDFLDDESKNSLENLEKEKMYDIHTKIFSKYFENRDFEGKVISNFDPLLCTNRFFLLPLKNKKKAEQMIPFQLDENLPYLASQAQFSQVFIPKGEGLHSVISICEINEFDQVYRRFEAQGALPHIWTSEVGIFQNYVNSELDKGSHLIVDMGHSSTRCYFIREGFIVSTHTSFFGGRDIDSFIAKTYKISLMEAQVFKEKNSFLLTKNQFNKVDENQAEFGKYMEDLFKPLVNDLQRWILGFRVAQGKKIAQIHLVGGVSQMKNLHNYLTQELSVDVIRLKSFEQKDFPKIQLGQDDSSKFSFAYILTKAFSNKSNILNFRTGQYAPLSYENIPLHSATFIGWRVCAVTVILFLAMMTERVMLSKSSSILDRQIRKVMKNPQLSIAGSKRSIYRRNPEKLHKLFLSKKKKLKKEITGLISASKINSLNSLFKLNKSVSSKGDVDLVEFEVADGSVSAVFSATGKDKAKILKSLTEELEKTDLEDLDISKIRKGQSEIEVKYYTPGV